MAKKTAAALAVGFLCLCACAPTIKRDLSKVPVGQIGFDDMCGLQTYFDDIELKKESAPSLISSTEFETQKGGHNLRAGQSRFAFQGRTELAHLRRILNDNWTPLPETVSKATRLDLDVHWSERDGLRRVASNQDAVLLVGSEEISLPYHVCLSELLYGAPLYHQRRQVMELPPLAGSPPAVEPAPANPAATQAQSPGAGGGSGTNLTIPAAGRALVGPADGGSGGSGAGGAGAGAGPDSAAVAAPAGIPVPRVPGPRPAGKPPTSH